MVYSEIICLILSILTIVKFTFSFDLNIIHVNDIHAHFEEVSAELGRCQKDKPCYGGAARMATKVIELR